MESIVFNDSKEIMDIEESKQRFFTMPLTSPPCHTLPKTLGECPVKIGQQLLIKEKWFYNHSEDLVEYKSIYDLYSKDDREALSATMRLCGIDSPILKEKDWKSAEEMPNEYARIKLTITKIEPLLCQDIPY